MTKRVVDFDGRPWAAHSQDSWLEFAGHPQFPDYLRCVFVAYGRHAANGHAKLKAKQLAHYLIREDGTLPARQSINRSIQHAVSLGFLMPGSRQLCLVVPDHHVQGGVGDPDLRCTRDHTVRQNVNTGRSRSRRKDNTGDGRSGQNVNTGRSRLTLAPSLSSSPGAPAPDTTHPTRRDSA